MAGAPGFLGPPLIADLTRRGYEVALVGRRGPDARWNTPAPRWLLEPGMLVLRQASELVLKSRWAVPAALLTTWSTEPGH